MSDSHPAGTAANQAARCSNPACGAWSSQAVQHCPTCGTLLQGVVLSQRFRIETLLGRGGMGTVYRARDLDLEREVALKVFAPSAVSARESPQDLRTRFFREARLAAQLDHPNIVPVLHSALDEALAYLVMPLFTGGTLASFLGHGRRHGPTQVLGWLRQMAAALDYAHHHKPPIIHRDVKPSNLLFHADERLCLADFGIARVGEAAPIETAPLTPSGVVLGSAAYIAPEQIQGHAVPASDQYSVGVVLYEALTGVRPFEAADPLALLLQQVSSPPPPPSQVVPGLPPEVEAAVLRALAKDPAARFPSVGALAAAFVPPSARGEPASLLLALADQRGELPTEPATPPHPRPDQATFDARRPGRAFAGAPPFQPPRTKNRWLRALSGGLVLLLIGVVVLLGVNSRGETANQNGSSSSTTQAPSATATATATSLPTATATPSGPIVDPGAAAVLAHMTAALTVDTTCQTNLSGASLPVGGVYINLCFHSNRIPVGGTSRVALYEKGRSSPAFQESAQVGGSLSYEWFIFRLNSPAHYTVEVFWNGALARLYDLTIG